MRYYCSKRQLEFIVVKHRLKGINTELVGVRYRDGYGVVALGSKEYNQLKKIPLAVEAEYPITYLINLKCIPNAKEIERVWGKPVYIYYKAVRDRQNNKPEELQIDTNPICTYIKSDGSKCKAQSLGYTEYCRHHAVNDNRIKAEYEALPMMPKKEKAEAVSALIKKLKAG